MHSIRVLICQVDDGAPDLMSELACFDLATPDVAILQPETALDALEATTQEIGTTILRRLLYAQWAEIDAALVAQHCARVVPAVVHPPEGVDQRWRRGRPGYPEGCLLTGWARVVDQG